MKNKLISILLMAAVALLMLAGLCACTASPTLERLSVSGYQTTFSVGDEFAIGDEFKAVAIYSDGSEEDVTSDVQIKKDVEFDMNVSGSYLITVRYEKKSFEYIITVGEYGTLSRLTLDTSSVKKTFKIGDKPSFDGLVVDGTYRSASGATLVKPIDDLSSLDFVVKDGEGGSIDVFSKEGEYSVIVSSGSVSASYLVNVEGASIDTMGGAVNVGTALYWQISNGVATVETTVSEIVDTSVMPYKFGDNYTFVGTPEYDYHYSLKPDGGVHVTTFQDGNEVPSGAAFKDVMFGPVYSIWNGSLSTYGLENTVKQLYNVAKNDPNGDYDEHIDEDARQYKFSFGAVARNISVSSSSDFYLTEVEFALATEDGYAITDAKIVQRMYREHDYELDGERVVLKDEDAYYKRITIVVRQALGDRTQKNPYYSDESIVRDYALTLDGKRIKDGDTLNLAVGTNVILKVSEFSPSASSFETDELKLGDGTQTTTNLTIFSRGYMAYYSEDEGLQIVPQSGGQYVLILMTSETQRTIHLNITGAAPTSISPEVYIDKSFKPSAAATVAVGEEIYLRGVVGKGKNGKYTAEITSGEGGVLEEAQLKDEQCYKFSSGRSGSYVITIISAVNPSARCELAIEVVLPPDYEKLFSGIYTVEDDEESTYLLVFGGTKNEGGVVSATLVITKTSFDGEDVQTEMLICSAEVDAMAITLAHVSGDDLGVIFAVLGGEFDLIDAYDNWYVLERS